MKLFDLGEKRVAANHVYMAFFMEGDMPTNIDNISLQDTVNNCLFARPYLHAYYSTGGRTIMQPMDRTATTNNWPLHSAWQEVDTVYGKQVLPKTRMRRLRDLTVTANRARPAEQVTNIMGCLLMPRFAQQQAAQNLLLSSVGSVTVDVETGNLAYPFTYDFGADVEVTGFMKMGVTTNSAASPLYQFMLQAQINGEWKDVTVMNNAPATTSDETIYPFTTDKVVARYFRLKKNGATTAQLCGAGIRFLGKYVNGAPRTFAKIGHVLMMPIAVGADFNGDNFYVNARCNIMHNNQYASLDDRIVAWNAYSVTDDPKKINSFDLFLPNGLTYEQGTDIYPPFFTVPTPITELGAV